MWLNRWVKLVSASILLMGLHGLFAQSPMVLNPRFAFKEALAYFRGIEYETDYLEAARLLEQAAAQDYAPAQLLLAGIYRVGGYGVKKNPALSRKWIEEAAILGVPDAEYELGIMAFVGKEIDLDIDLAIEMFYRAAQKGHAESQYALAMCCHGSLGVDYDLSKVRFWLDSAAQQGHLEAQKALAKSYETSKPPAYAKAVFWYEKAAAQNDAEAVLKLAGFHRQGLGVEKNHKTALGLCQPLAESGYASAQFQLATYLLESDLNGDREAAEKWLLSAAKAGHEKAAERLLLIYSDDPAKTDRIQGFMEVLHDVAEKGSLSLQIKLFKLYSEGKEADPDNQNALLWGKRVAGQGYDPAQVFLYHHYLQKDPRKAFEWLKVLGYGHDAVWKYRLAQAYFKGEGVAVDVSEGVSHLKASAQSGYAEAQFEYGKAFLRGEKVPQNLSASRLWLGKAAGQRHREAQLALEEMREDEAVTQVESKERERGSGSLPEAFLETEVLDVDIQEPEEEPEDEAIALDEAETPSVEDQKMTKPKRKRRKR